ncbi:hypothetical protein MPH_01474 [Macrophomina phaseolina MS6]|uniref:Uncharacterized protein n=1 Tax=Macrophomina phaseolina (strain MS6) TaxID=1126212 RepID=K2RFB2_MACPH|nr:hypothetical protein MPH_01474 [Macrophomina phaseolina MS6]
MRTITIATAKRNRLRLILAHTHKQYQEIFCCCTCMNDSLRHERGAAESNDIRRMHASVHYASRSSVVEHVKTTLYSIVQSKDSRRDWHAEKACRCVKETIRCSYKTDRIYEINRGENGPEWFL